ncbi:MAG TPA: hypothetical protein VFM53_06995 [Anaeromyxobacteraceae bacterium]|nr:hypothetical protein [Anaeromyxobacteraceae bacterium]
MQVVGDGEARPELPASASPIAPGPGGPVPAARLSPPRPPRGSPAPVAFLAGLRDLEAGVRSCNDGTAAAGGGRAARTVFLLAFETTGGVARIVDVLVQARGSASEEVIQCARERLLGREIAASAAAEGQQFEAPLAPWR